MTTIPILDKAYWTALEILTDEVGSIKECIAEGLPWFPIDPVQLEWAMKTYRNWHPDSAKTYLLTFPWPEPGEVPDIPARYFVPTDEEKAKIRRLIDKYGGSKDAWVKDIVELAKTVVQEVH
jgi:hypothetical protein